MHELALEWNMQIEKVAVSMFSDMRGLYNEPLYGFSLNIEERVMSKIRIEDALLGDHEGDRLAIQPRRRMCCNFVVEPKVG